MPEKPSFHCAYAMHLRGQNARLALSTSRPTDLSGWVSLSPLVGRKPRVDLAGLTYIVVVFVAVFIFPVQNFSFFHLLVAVLKSAIMNAFMNSFLP